MNSFLVYNWQGTQNSEYSDVILIRFFCTPWNLAIDDLKQKLVNGHLNVVHEKDAENRVDKQNSNAEVLERAGEERWIMKTIANGKHHSLGRSWEKRS